MQIRFACSPSKSNLADFLPSLCALTFSFLGVSLPLPYRNLSQHQVNVDVAGMLARAAKAQGVKNFVHVSALAADPDSPSRWAQTKVRM